MDKKKLIDKYRKKEEEAQILLKDGGIVIGQEADENNHLQYVIRYPNKIVVEYAGNTRPVKGLIQHTGETKVVTRSIKEGKKNKPVI